MEFRGTISNEGEIRFTQPTSLYMKAPDLAGRHLKIEIKEVKKRDSPPQRGYYFGVVCAIAVAHINSLPADERGNKIFTTKEMHKQFTKMFLTEAIVRGGHIILEYQREFHTMNISERSDFVSEAKSWVEQTFNTEVPSPNEQLSIES
jgi:hypothetical protein